MATASSSSALLQAELSAVRERLQEAEETLQAIRTGTVDAIVVDTPEGERVFSLSGAERSYRLMVERMNQGAAVVREDGLVVFCNVALAGMLGTTLEGLTGTNFGQWVPPELQEEMGKLNATARRKNSNKEMRLLRKDGSQLPVLLGISAMGAANPGTLCVLATDLTEQKERETALQSSQSELRARARELARSNQELQDFAVVASHDLQEPLRKIRTFSDRLLTCNASQIDADGRFCLQRVFATAQRMSELLDALLAYSRISTRAQPMRAVSLRVLVAEVLSDLELAIRECGAQISVGNLPVVSADAMQMRQLFQNLLSNCLRYRRPGITLHISLEARNLAGNMAEITVRDNGIGFEPQFAERIFRPFQRLLPGAQCQGVGMGLTICRRIVSRHGGRIEARGEPGVGSTFALTLQRVTSAGKKG